MAKDDDGTVNWSTFKDRQKSDFRKKMISGKGKKGFSASSGKKTYNAPVERKMPPAWKMRHRDNKFKPDQTPTRIRIIPTTEKDPYYTFYTKWIKNAEGQNRSLISNAWNGDRQLPCVLYYYCERDENENYWADEKKAVTVLVLEDFYKVPHTSKNGYEYFTYERVPTPDRHGRIHHPTPAHEGYEVVFGRKLWWEMWDSQRRELEEKLGAVSEKCGNCDRGEISTYAYACSNCGSSFGNHHEEPIDPEVESQLRSMKVECESCGHFDKAEQLIECVHVEGHGSQRRYVEGCGNPKQLDWKDCEFVVSAISVGNRTAIKIDDFSVYEDQGLADWMNDPMDFDYFLGRQDLDEQAKSMGRKNPFDGSAQRALEKHFETARDEEDQDSVPMSDDDDIF